MHSLDMSNNRVNMAFTGPRKAIWHGLGNELSPGSSIDVWIKEAGMDWVALESEVLYKSENPYDPYLIYPKKKLLYRSDTLIPLSVVSNDFKIVQPGEVLEFFRDLTEQHGMVLSTAGCLYGGQRFWALAETGFESSVVQGDPIKGHLLFTTALDGTLASTAKFVSTRVVCNNTLTIALKESTTSEGRHKNAFKRTHRQVWDGQQAKIDLGLIDASWNSFMTDLRRLSDKKMSDSEVTNFLKKTCFAPNCVFDTKGETKKLDKLLGYYKYGAGSEYSYGTAYGALNAITDFYTHLNARTQDRAFQNAYFTNEGVRRRAMENLLENC